MTHAKRSDPCLCGACDGTHTIHMANVCEEGLRNVYGAMICRGLKSYLLMETRKRLVPQRARRSGEEGALVEWLNSKDLEDVSIELGLSVNMTYIRRQIASGRAVERYINTKGKQVYGTKRKKGVECPTLTD